MKKGPCQRTSPSRRSGRIRPTKPNTRRSRRCRSPLPSERSPTPLLRTKPAGRFGAVILASRDAGSRVRDLPERRPQARPRSRAQGGFATGGRRANGQVYRLVSLDPAPAGRPDSRRHDTLPPAVPLPPLAPVRRSPRGLPRLARARPRPGAAGLGEPAGRRDQQARPARPGLPLRRPGDGPGPRPREVALLPAAERPVEVQVLGPPRRSPAPLLRDRLRRRGLGHDPGAGEHREARLRAPGLRQHRLRVGLEHAAARPAAARPRRRVPRHPRRRPGSERAAVRARTT